MKYEAFKGLTDLVEENYPGLVIEDTPVLYEYFGEFIGYKDVKTEFASISNIFNLKECK